MSNAGNPVRRAQEARFSGQMLVAMPSMPDERFARSVVYMCAHSHEGAMGIVVNKRAKKVAFSDLLVQLDLIGEDQAIALPGGAGATPVLRGGPMERERGFVLHSADFSAGESTVEIDASVRLTATLDVLRAIAHGQGPSRAVLALGYASWAPGQLENEIQHNGWLTGVCDPSLIFDDDQDAKYARALRSIGVDPTFLSGEGGRA
ncbi:MAG: YqgE/AlgH family protein [Hyphomicrobiales bacterium]|nr:YqgE/AlgH family protein [Hyphomicrobiales bacterium]